MELVKEMKDFPTNTNDLKFYKTMHEHIGEARPIAANGCEHPYLVLSNPLPPSYVLRFPLWTKPSVSSPVG
jgi:hypothetical protein